MKRKYTLFNLDEEKKSGRKWIFGSFFPNSSNRYTKHIEIGYVALLEVEKTDVVHMHSMIEEYYVVIEGEMRIQISKEIVTVSAGQILLVRPNTEHIIVSVEPETKILLIKAPSVKNDKIVSPST